MNIFIDTNIFLSFYHFTSDDLEELKKLVVLLSNGRVRLFLPQQVLDEFWRHRENKIADALNRLRDQRLNLQFPQFCKDYEEFDNLRQLQKSYAKVHSDLVQRVVEDIQGQRLKADLVIQDLFEKGTVIPTTEEVYDKASHRVKIGNPPGKEGSLGDAINWEVLLERVPAKEKLYFVTDDKDFASTLDSSQFNGFLLAEWKNCKGSDLVFYKSLSTFFKENFPEITLASELEKDLVIRDLANSASFAQTHSIIAKLRQFSDFSTAQVNAIVQAAISNNQIYWIIEDADVYDFLQDVIKGKESQIEPENLAELHRLLKTNATTLEIEDDLPF
jgi:predicted nucleic acid-binding protein